MTANFTTRAVLFVVTLVVSVAAVEIFAKRRISGSDDDLVGIEVYDAVRRATLPGPDVERIFVGDSVARQFFPPGGEPNARVRFLTTNANITLAGDFYLIDEAFRRCPNAREIVVVARPETLQTNLESPATKDYFSTFFHEPAQIREMWALKRDPGLAASQAVRWALPGTMALNSIWRQDPRSFRTRGPGRARDPVLWPTRVALSETGAHFLARMQALAASRGGRVRVVAVPLPDSEPWTDPDGLIHEPFMYLSKSAFGDGVHLGPVGMRSCVGTSIARRFAELHGLADDLPSSFVPTEPRCEDAANPLRRVRN